MTKFSNKLKKSCFWLILGPFSQFFGEKKKKKIPRKSSLSHTTSYKFLAPCQILEKINDTIPRKRLDRRMDGRMEGQKDGQALFYRTLPATAGGPKTTNVYYSRMNCHSFM